MSYRALIALLLMIGLVVILSRETSRSFWAEGLGIAAVIFVIYWAL